MKRPLPRGEAPVHPLYGAGVNVECGLSGVETLGGRAPPRVRVGRECRVWSVECGVWTRGGLREKSLDCWVAVVSVIGPGASPVAQAERSSARSAAPVIERGPRPTATMPDCTISLIPYG